MQNSKKGLRSNDLTSLKRLRLAAQQAEQVVQPAVRPLPKRKRVAQAQLAASQAANAQPPAPDPAPAMDAGLFRQAMKAVTPLKGHERVVTAPIPTASRQMLMERRQHASGVTQPRLAVQVSDHYAAILTDNDDRVFVRSPHATDLIKGLKRGKWPVQASLDLHGSTQDEARERLDRFLHSCLEHRLRCVRIVHGKGYGSRDGMPVLKEVVRRWLSQLASVQAYIECDEMNGGAGAVQALLNLPAPEDDLAL